MTPEQIQRGIDKAKSMAVQIPKPVQEKHELNISDLPSMTHEANRFICGTMGYNIGEFPLTLNQFISILEAMK